MQPIGGRQMHCRSTAASALPVGLRSSAAGAALLGLVVHEQHGSGCSTEQWCVSGAAEYAIDLVLRLGLSVELGGLTGGEIV